MKDRIALWDNYKFVLITLMVIGHFSHYVTKGYPTNQAIFLFIYSFHMPAFIFVAGMFHNDRRIKSRVLFFICAGFLLKALLAVIERLNGTVAPEFTVLGGLTLPWFMFSMAWFTLLRYLLRDRNPWFVIGAFVVLACFAGYDKSIGDYLYLSRTIVFFPFYMAGSALDPEKTAAAVKKHKWYYAAALAVLCLWGWCCLRRLDFFYRFRHLFTGRNPFSSRVIAYGPLARLFCYAVTCVTGLSLLVLTPSRRLPGITVWGGRTLEVFFWHKLFFNVLDLPGLFYRGTPYKEIYYVLAILMTVLIAAVPWFSFPLRQLRTLCYRTTEDGGGK
ncbi:MAG: hypothetical protein IKQ10_09690 [Oscillospiraceae bacterium]|nr:hypothetical protein [Oscillospiraceae bacterium]